MTTHLTGEAEANANANALLVGRLERIPVTQRLLWIRVIIGSATFFDAYTVLVIAFAMPQLVKEWGLSPAEVGLILSAGYVGQLVGAIGFGYLAERIGRLPTLLITIVLFVSMDVACLFAFSGASMMLFRFLQGIGTGGEVPVASAYINEFIGAKKRGRFFLLYELIFPIGLLFAGISAYFLVPNFGWKALFIVGIIPALIMIPLRVLMPESPRWLASKGRIAKADKIVSMLENEAVKEGKPLPEPVIRPVDPKATQKSDWRELFKGIYLKRTLMIWVLWIAVYTINNGMITWLPTLYTQVFDVPLQTSLLYGWTTSAFGVAASVACALLIDKVGRKRWYTVAFLLAVVPLVALALLGATSADPDPGRRHHRLRHPADHRVLPVPVLRRALPDPAPRHRHRVRLRLAPRRILPRPRPGRLHRRRRRHPVRLRALRRHRRHRRPHHQVLRHRNQRQGPGGTLTLTLIRSRRPRPARRGHCGRDVPFSRSASRSTRMAVVGAG